MSSCCSNRMHVHRLPEGRPLNCVESVNAVPPAPPVIKVIPCRMAGANIYSDRSVPASVGGRGHHLRVPPPWAEWAMRTHWLRISSAASRPPLTT